jgi:Tol biopolymer transport system component
LTGRFPQFLPDGRHFVYYGFYGSAASETRGVYVAQLDGSAPQHLIDVDEAPVYAPSGHLLFVRQGTLVAQPFDADTFELTGDPFPVMGGMTINGPLAVSPLSASNAGPIAYRTGSAGGLRQFAWFDRSGREIGKLGDPASNLLSPELSPDGRHVALHRVMNGNADIWLLETGRGVLSRFTTAASAEYFPIWSPDGARLVFGSGGNVLRKAIAGGDTEQLLQADASPNDWSLDGRFLLYSIGDPNSEGRAMWVLPLVRNPKPFPVVQTKFNAEDGQFSPDGEWIAYTSDESGRPEVYIQPFPGPGARSQMSTNGGGMARWRRDGKEIFYIALDGRLIAVPIRSPSNGQAALDAGAPIPLFTTRIGGPVQANSRQQYMVSADGQRFLMNTVAEENAAPITVILNWKARP